MKKLALIILINLIALGFLFTLNTKTARAQSTCTASGNSPTTGKPCCSGLSVNSSGLCVATSQSGSGSSSTPTTGTWYNQSFKEFWVKVYDENYSAPNEIFGERYTAAQVQWVIYSLLSFIASAGDKNNQEIISCAMSGNITQCLPPLLDKLVHKTGEAPQKSFLATLTSNPISGVGYFSNLTNKFSLVPEVHAQTPGFGYGAANFVLNLWRISRNTAYALLVVAVLIMSFMIMFRMKISQQTVISVQSALPKIVATLILITFSYAIAGFLIDLMYVSLGLLTTFIKQNGLTGYLTWGELYSAFASSDIALLMTGYWISFTALLFQTLPAFTGIIALVLSILALLMLLYYTVMIIYMLLKTFVNIMFLIMLAPFQILAGTIISGAGFGQWLRKMLGNLLIYPVIAFMLFFACYLLRQALGGGLNSTAAADWVFTFNPTYGQFDNIWRAPFFGVQTGGLFSIKVLFTAISFVIISMIPNAAELIKSIMEGKEFGGSQIGRQVGQGVEQAKSITRGVGEGSGQVISVLRDSGGMGQKTGAVLNALKWLALLPK